MKLHIHAQGLQQGAKEEVATLTLHLPLEVVHLPNLYINDTSSNAICNKVLEVDGDGKRCCKLLLFALHLCCLFVVNYVWWFDVYDFLL